jgi:multicomponent Na+:H+ antiporter subunit D
MPPFATSLGKTAIEDAAHSYAWVPWLFGFAGALTGGAVLRATARMFLGWGPDEPDEYAAAGYAERGEEERETTEGTDHIPAVLVAPAVVLLAAALALGLAPRLAERGEIAAAQFVDTRAYTSFVLDGVDRAARVTPHPTAPIGALYGGLAAAAAIALAAAALFRTRVSESVRERMRPVLAPLHALRSAHSGHAGDYVMWFTVGLAALGGLLFAVARGPG